MENEPNHSAPGMQPEGRGASFTDFIDAVIDAESFGAALKLLLPNSLFWKLYVRMILFGIGTGVMLALGNCLGIGFHAAWKIYKYWWISSPLFGLMMILFILLLSRITIATIALVGRLVGPKRELLGLALLLMLILGIAMLVGGYFSARQDNPILSAQPANLDTLTKAVGDQSHILGDLSQSGKALLGQLTATEIELENAKKQLSTTLASFDSQRQAAGQVSEELKRIDARQKQIALQTEELQRILEGQQPITRQDLQHANMQGWIFGLIIGFLTSFLASMAHNALGKRKSAVS